MTTTRMKRRSSSCPQPDDGEEELVKRVMEDSLRTHAAEELRGGLAGDRAASVR